MLRLAHQGEFSQQQPFVILLWLLNPKPDAALICEGSGPCAEVVVLRAFISSAGTFSFYFGLSLVTVLQVCHF